MAQIVASEIDLWAKFVESTLFTAKGAMLGYRLMKGLFVSSIRGARNRFVAKSVESTPFTTEGDMLV